jgi:hypothetical protein
MLKTLIERNGSASLEDIAATFLAHDQSQIEYYIEITKRMPGPVLTRHGLVQREGTGFSGHTATEPKGTSDGKRGSANVRTYKALSTPLDVNRPHQQWLIPTRISRQDDPYRRSSVRDGNKKY